MEQEPVFTIVRHITNTSTHKLQFSLEPWGDMCSIFPDKTLTVVAKGFGKCDIDIEMKDGEILLAWCENCKIAIGYIDSIVVCYGLNLNPNVFLKMSTQEFVEYQGFLDWYGRDTPDGILNWHKYTK